MFSFLFTRSSSILSLSRPSSSFFLYFRCLVFFLFLPHPSSSSFSSPIPPVSLGFSLLPFFLNLPRKCKAASSVSGDVWPPPPPPPPPLPPPPAAATGVTARNASEANHLGGISSPRAAVPFGKRPSSASLLPAIAAVTPRALPPRGGTCGRVLSLLAEGSRGAWRGWEGVRPVETLPGRAAGSDASGARLQRQLLSYARPVSALQHDPDLAFPPVLCSAPWLPLFGRRTGVAFLSLFCERI